VFDSLRSAFGESLDFQWHAYETRPEPTPILDSKFPRLGHVYQTAIPIAEARGLVLKMPPVVSRTKLAFEALFAARTLDKFDEMYRAISKAYFADGTNIGSIDVLLSIGFECGIDKAWLKNAIESGQFSHVLAADRQLAATVGVEGLPFAVFSRSDDVERRVVIAVREAAPIEHYFTAIDQLFPDGIPQQGSSEPASS
jgi:predicted DsbA family dithiol-disulfide isomerase